MDSLNNPPLLFNQFGIRVLMQYQLMLNELIKKHNIKKAQCDVLSSIKADNQAEKQRVEAEIACEERAAVLKELLNVTSRVAGRTIETDLTEAEEESGMLFHMDDIELQKKDVLFKLKTTFADVQAPLSNVSSASTLAPAYEFRPVDSFFSPTSSRETTPNIFEDRLSPPKIELPIPLFHELRQMRMDEFEQKFWEKFLLRKARGIKTTRAHQVLTPPPVQQKTDDEENGIVPEGGIFVLEL